VRLRWLRSMGFYRKTMRKFCWELSRSFQIWNTVVLARGGTGWRSYFPCFYKNCLNGFLMMKGCLGGLLLWILSEGARSRNDRGRGWHGWEIAFLEFPLMLICKRKSRHQDRKWIIPTHPFLPQRSDGCKAIPSQCEGPFCFI
jgi:hypothetical protein